MRQIVASCVYAIAMGIPLLTLFSARSSRQVAASLSASVLAALALTTLPFVTRGKSGEWDDLFLLCGYVFVVIATVTVAAVYGAVRSRLNRRRIEDGWRPTLSKRDATSLALVILGAAVLVSASITAWLYMSWRAGDTLSDGPPTNYTDFEWVAPGQTTFGGQVAGTGTNDLYTPASEPFFLSGKVLGWTRDSGWEMLVLRISGSQVKAIEPGDQVAIHVSDPDSAGLGSAMKGSEVRIEVGFYGSGPSLKTVRDIPGRRD